MPSIWDTWKDRFFERLVDLQRRFVQARPQSVYTALCAAALLPLAQAAHGGELMAVVLALGSVSAGVGSNLIAKQFQRWRDQAEPPSEAQVATWVASQANANTEVRQALDAILEYVEAIQQAQADDVHSVSSLPVMRRPVYRAWVDTRPVQIFWAECFATPDPDVVDDRLTERCRAHQGLPRIRPAIRMGVMGIVDFQILRQTSVEILG